MRSSNSIFFASSNPEKLKEVKFVLGKEGIRVKQVKADLREIRSDDQKKVAEEKAREAFRKIGNPAIAEDTGVYFDAFENFPGVLAASVFRGIGYEGLLKLLKGKSRKAHFKTIVAHYDGRKATTFEGVCKGEMTEKPDEKKFRKEKFPYEAIFIPEGCAKRISRMSAEEKMAISHRAKALRKFAEWFKNKKG